MSRKIFSVSRGEHFSVNILGHLLYSYIDNLIMSFSTANWQDIPSPKFGADNLRFDRITPKNIGDSITSGLYLRGMAELLLEKDRLLEGFFMYDKNTDLPVSRLWVMFRTQRPYDLNGGYRIITPKAWIFNANTLGNYRGQGIYTYLLKQVFRYLSAEKSIDTVYLSVARKNFPALRSYEKCGGRVQGRKVSLRFLRWSFPKYTL